MRRRPRTSSPSANAGGGPPREPRLRLTPAGFWQKASSWALPRDARGEGYWPVARDNAPELGFCVLFVFASSWGQTFLLSVFQPHWARDLHLDPASLGSLYGGATLLSGFLLPWAGRWLDRTPVVRTAVVTLIGLGFFSLALAGVTHAWMLGICLFGLRFFGQGLSPNIGLANASRWFTHNRGKALSLSGLGFPLGEALLPGAVTLSVLALGWRFTWLLLGGVCLLLFLPAARALIRRGPAAEGPSSETASNQRYAGASGGLLRDWRFLAMLGVVAPLGFVGTGIIFFQGVIAESRHWHAAVFPTGFFVFAVLRALFSLSMGAWVDRLGAVRLLAIPALLFAVGLGFLLRPEPFWAYLFFAFIGLSFGASGAIASAAWPELFGLDRIGQIRGLSSSFGVFFTAIAPVVFGFVLKRGLSVEAIILGCAALMLGVALPCGAALIRERRRSGY